MFYGRFYHSDMARIKDLNRSEILVYCVLISHGGADRSFASSHSKIAKIAGVSAGSVKRSLKKFEDLGILEKSDFYQVKKYHLHQTDQVEEKDQQVDHSFDPPENKKVDQAVDLGVDQAVDLGIDQAVDLHVKENKNKIINSFMTSDEKIFLNLVKRWFDLGYWKITTEDEVLMQYRKIKDETDGLDHGLELQIIDSWLLMQKQKEDQRVWRSGFLGRIKSWFQRQLQQGSRSNANQLSKQQKYFFSFAVKVDVIPEIPATQNQIVTPSKQGHVERVESIASTSEFDRVDEFLYMATNNGDFDLNNPNSMMLQIGRMLWPKFQFSEAEQQHLQSRTKIFNDLMRV